MPIQGPNTFQADVLDQPGTVLVDDRPPGGTEGITHLFSHPLEIIIADRAEEVPRALTQLEEQLQKGRFAAGFLSYDAGLALDRPLRSRHRPNTPLVWLGVYDSCASFAAGEINLGPPGSIADIGSLELNVSETEYLAAVAQVKDYLRSGDVYQINYTCKLRFRHGGSPRALFSRLRQSHVVCHSAWINTGRQQVMSLSPELFLRRDGQIVRTRPMKGTMRRGRWFEEDQTLERALPSDPKNRAENVMIVDLMRNDFGRVCRFGTVQVAQALAVERYRTLFQMTSEVVGQLRAGTSIESLLRATFPPGSVTGTPKLRAITLIDELEKESRGVYCGTIGLFRPGGDCLLNVAIRTIVQQDDTCELGLGSGIVADSDPAAEWQEVWLKGRFLQAEPPSFQLLETLFAPSQQTPLYLDEHLERLRQSAAYFGWSFSEKEVRALLRAASGKTGGDSRLRVLVAEHGACAVERRGTAPPPERPVKVLLAQRRTNSNNVFLYHKTTERGAYDADWHAARQQGFFDLVYRNQDGDITEGAITNLIAEIDGQWYTPPLSCGLLPGIWRAAVVRQRGVKERRLQLEDLLRATRIVLGNSVRGAVELDQVYSASQREPIWTRLCRPRGGLQWD